MNPIALPLTVSDLIEEYAEKDAAIELAIKDFEAAHERLGMAATVHGTYVERIADKPFLNAACLRKNLLKSGWRAVYNRLQIDAVASANDKKLFDRALADPAPLTLDNAKATFGDYITRPRFHVLRGLAEVFCSLDPAYKSHSKVKFGVKGLPKRVILNGWGEYSYGNARDRFRDMVNALAALRGQVPCEYGEMSALDCAHSLGEDAVLDGRSYRKPDRRDPTRGDVFQTVDRGLTVRKFGNGNAHVFFTAATLLDINRALAEFYGDVLPDAEPEGVKPSASTAVAKDLQFYWTPPAVVALALDFAGIHTREYYRSDPPALRVLEPSCGDGRILDELRARGCRSLGIEYHPGRAREAIAKGHAVLCANFLDQPTTADFDAVVMNPPFVGRHYAKHVRHALGFLKPGGTLVAILPATARYDHDEVNGQWQDLPVASFADAGTNVPTTMLKIVKNKNV